MEWHQAFVEYQRRMGERRNSLFQQINRELREKQDSDFARKAIQQRMDALDVRIGELFGELLQTVRTLESCAQSVARHNEGVERFQRDLRSTLELARAADVVQADACPGALVPFE